MASTKEMMARAKARKQENKFRIDENTMASALTAISEIILLENDKHGYDQTELSLDCAKMIVKQKGMDKRDYLQLLEFRERMDAALKKAFNAKLINGMGAFSQDPEKVMKKAGVPQTVRVMYGLLDTLIWVLAVHSGVIEVHHVA